MRSKINKELTKHLFKELEKCPLDSDEDNLIETTLTILNFGQLINICYLNEPDDSEYKYRLKVLFESVESSIERGYSVAKTVVKYHIKDKDDLRYLWQLRQAVKLDLI